MKKNKICNVCKKKLKYFINIGDHPCADTFLKSKKKLKNLIGTNFNIVRINLYLFIFIKF